MIKTIFSGKITPKGRWLSNKDGLKVRCSNCGQTPITEVKEHKYNASIGINWTFNERVEKWFSYCPYCGADMRGEE